MMRSGKVVQITKHGSGWVEFDDDPMHHHYFNENTPLGNGVFYLYKNKPIRAEFEHTTGDITRLEKLANER